MRENEPTIHIQRATADDASSIASVLHASFVEYESFYTPEALAATTPSGERILHRMSEGPVWVARQHDTIVGTVSVVPENEGIYIRGMAILPTVRGQGIGRRLLSQGEEIAARHGYERLFLSTTPFLSRAIRLYEQYGFRRTEEGPHELFGSPPFTMVRALTAVQE